jgi:signal transduction histidine kinase
MFGRLLRFALLPVGVAGGVAVEWVFYDASQGLALAVADLVVGCVLIGFGVLAWDRRPASRVGLLGVVAGGTWFLGNVATPLVYLHRGALLWVLLSYPTGRSQSRLARAVIVAACVDAAIEPVARNNPLTLVLSGAAVLASADLFRRSSGPARRARGAALLVTLAFAGVLALGAAGRLVAWEPDGVLWAYDAVIAFGIVVLTADLLRGRWTEAVVTGLVVDLGTTGETGTLRAKVARAVGDPSLVIAYRLRDGAGFVDDAGRPVALPSPGSGRTVMPLVDRGEQVAVLVHDEALLADPQLVASVAAAARIALANASLQAEARAKAVELEASRRRVVEAAAEERLEIQRRLQRGAGRRLERVAALLSDVSSAAGEADAAAVGAVERELAATRVEVEEFSRGLHPAALSEGGLASALRELARRSPVPVEIGGRVGRVPAPVEAALFFVCSEGLANVAKHAGAAAASIDIGADSEHVVVEIADDGAGGAELRRGSGLAGLADRVEALGGRLRVESRPGEGTRLRAELPLSGG